MTNTGAVIPEGSKRSSGGVDALFSSDLGKSAIEQATARANIGVVTAGGVSAVSGEMTPATGIAATDFAAYAHTDGVVTGVLFRIVHAGGTYDVSGDDSRFGTANLRGVEFASSTGVLTFYADGVANATTQALTAGAVTITKILSAATGTLRSSVIFSRALTADERSSVMRGEFTAAMKTSCVARYEPETVTSLGRWLDSSGNGYDLIPGSGITPLKPQPVQVREAWIKYNIGGSAPSVIGVNKGAIAAAVKTATGVFTTTLASFIPSANRVSAQCNPFEVDPTYVQARGQGIVAVPASQFVMLTKQYNSDVLVDVSHTSCVRWTE